MLMSAAVYAVEVAPTMGPIVRPPLLEQKSDTVEEETQQGPAVQLDATGVAADLKALSHAVEIIRSALREEHGTVTPAEGFVEEAAVAGQGRTRQPWVSRLFHHVWGRTISKSKITMTIPEMLLRTLLTNVLNVSMVS